MGEKTGRAGILARLKESVGRPDNLEASDSADESLCGETNLFYACLTEETIGLYASQLVPFLVGLGCNDKNIARGLVRYRLGFDDLKTDVAKPIKLAFAKGRAEIKKDCPGWSAHSGSR